MLEEGETKGVGGWEEEESDRQCGCLIKRNVVKEIKR